MSHTNLFSSIRKTAYQTLIWSKNNKNYISFTFYSFSNNICLDMFRYMENYAETHESIRNTNV